MNPVSSSVQDFLRRCRLDGLTLHVPAERIDPKVYAEAKKALVIFGGKWQTGKQAFVFTKDPAANIATLLGTGKVVNEKKDRQAFYTPADVAKLAVKHADVRGKSVLEPSAGDGSLARACVRDGAKGITCVEMDPDECAKLYGFDAAYNADFLKFGTGIGTFDRVVMNPPFTEGQFHKHIAHAVKFLRPDGVLVAIVPDADCPQLAKLGAETMELLPAGTFRDSGTNIATRIIRIQR